VAWLDLLGVVTVFGVFGKSAMSTVALKENTKTETPRKALAAARASEEGDLRTRQRVQQENEKKADHKWPGENEPGKGGGYDRKYDHGCEPDTVQDAPSSKPSPCGWKGRFQRLSAHDQI
jgi:hypothetical protein